MADVRVRIGEADRPQPCLLWDSVWDPRNGNADWAIAGQDETSNRGGLRAKSALHTAIVLALFTDKRIPQQHPLRKYVDSDDPRGWWGDDVDIRTEGGEAELGSLLWVFERAVLTEAIRLEVIAEAQNALQCLIDQGAATRIDAQAEMYAAFNRLDLAIQIYGTAGGEVYAVKFEDVWAQTK